MMINSGKTAQRRSELVRELFETYKDFSRTEIRSRRFTQAQMIGWLEPMLAGHVVASSELGHSSEGRPISLYSYGNGPTRVLLWSQMHGDEPTATMALLDILNLFASRPDHPVVRTIRDSLTLLMIPMLNPDGAERFTRRTAQLVDMNRDAGALVTPEANILMDTQHSHRPQFGFNLHDQEPRLTVGSSRNVAAVALLAPAMNESREDNDVRTKAKKVASVFAEALAQLVPGHTAKYDDAYEPRAFGDSVQRWGTSTVLVESGGWPGDRDKMFIRRLNYVGLLVSLQAIATGDYHHQNPSWYESLPYNSKNLYDVIVRGVELRAEDRTAPVRVDLAFNIEDLKRDDGSIGLAGRLVDVGDLSTYGTFDERDGKGVSLRGTQIRLDQVIPWETVELLLK